MSSASEKTTEWVWHQIGLQVPVAWECLQYSRNPDVGRCAFADRYGFRLELNWRRFKSEPDFERMLKDYARSLESSWGKVRSVTCRSWPGLTGKRGKEAVSRFGRYLHDIGLLVELVFIHEDRRDKELEARLLPTVRVVAPDDAGYQQWRAFGMEMHVPARFTIAQCVVEPARIGLRFDGARRPDRWIFRRYGMVDSWLKQPLRDWLAQQADAEVRDIRPESTTRGSIGIERLNGRWKPRGLLLPRGQFASSAWVDPEDKRLYQAICITGKRHQAQHPNGGADEMMKSCPEFLVIPKIR